MIHNKDTRICFIGDSFVNGTGDPEHLGWVGRVCALSQTNEMEITHYNLGIRGNTSVDIRKRWQNESTIRLPKYSRNLLVFSFGVNDTAFEAGTRRVSIPKSIESTGAILTQASKIFDVLMIGPPPIADVDQNKRIRELNEHFQSISAGLAIPYLSIYELLLEDALWLTEVASNDGAHPKSAGYTRLAKLVLAWDHWLKC